MEIPLLNPEAQGTYPINWFFVLEIKEGRRALVRTPGLKKYIDMSHTLDGPVRCFTRMKGKVYTLFGKDLYAITDKDNYTDLGSIDSIDDAVIMRHNGTQVLMCVRNKNAWLYDSSDDSLEELSLPFTPATAAYMDGYFIMNGMNSFDLFRSDWLDGSTWDAGNYDQAAKAPDNVLTLGESSSNNLWALGEVTSQIYYNAGSPSSFPFAVVPGGFHRIGIGAAMSLGEIDNSLFLLDNFGMIRRIIGYRTVVISPPWLNKRIEQMNMWQDAYGSTFSYQGQDFYAITFMDARETFVYNATTSISKDTRLSPSSFWHKWQSVEFDAPQNLGPHRGRCFVGHGKKILVGDYEKCIIYELDSDVYKDGEYPITSSLILPPVYKDREYIPHGRIEAEFKAGVGRHDWPNESVVENPEIETDDDWTKGADWSWDGANKQYDFTYDADDATRYLYQSNVLEEGAHYRVVAKFSNFAVAQARVLAGNVGYGTTRTADGVYQEDLVCMGNTSFYVQCLAGSGSLDWVYAYKHPLGENPKAILEYSDDDLRTWSKQDPAPIGRAGKYGQKAVWRRKGTSIRRHYKISITDPVEATLKGVYLD